MKWLIISLVIVMICTFSWVRFAHVMHAYRTHAPGVVPDGMRWLRSERDRFLRNHPALKQEIELAEQQQLGPLNCIYVFCHKHLSRGKKVYVGYTSEGIQSTYDFERLYTNIPQQDLKSRLSQLVAQVFARHPDAVGVQVFKQKGLPMRWLFEQPHHKTSGVTRRMASNIKFSHCSPFSL